MKRLDPHARFRELLAARLDRPLSRAEQRVLVGHLKACADCQRAERDYRDQSALLRGLPTPEPPRDMWARTSTALDVEMARSRYRYPRRRGVLRPRPAAGGALVTTVAALAAITVVVGTQVAPMLQRAPATDHARPTPFAVQPQSIAFVAPDAADASALTIYRTQVDQVCPTAYDDCYREEHFVRSEVPLKHTVTPTNVELSPGGERIAIVGDDATEDVVTVVEFEGQGGGSPERPQRTPPNTEPRTPAPGTPKPASGKPGASEPPGRTSSPRDSHEPTPPPASTGAGGQGTGASAQPASPPASSVSGLKVLSILEDVETTGAPPAWSPDGEILAFSAMPANRSHGPDVYIWQPGDEQATRITDDHKSFFASWSGRRIVLSRVDGLDQARSSVNVTTLVVDPSTFEVRAVKGPNMWLPVVDPQKDRAITLYGQLESDGNIPRVRQGILYLVDWAAIDPFRNEAGSVAQSHGATDDDKPGAGSSPDPASPEPATTDAPREPDANAPALFEPVDPDADPLRSPVTDWQVRWSKDGQVVGVWIADSADSAWGRLVVMALDGSRNISQTAPVIGPMLAKRGFTLGLNRVAWVARTDDGNEGEVRIRTWGNDGDGGLRLEPVDLEEVVPAF